MSAWSRTTGLLVTLVAATLMLASALLLAVAEEMPWLPDSWIRHASKELARKRTLRNLYICFVVGIVFITTVVNMVNHCLVRCHDSVGVSKAIMLFHFIVFFMEMSQRFFLRITWDIWIPPRQTTSIMWKIAKIARRCQSNSIIRNS